MSRHRMVGLQLTCGVFFKGDESMFTVNGTEIALSRGDTGALRILANATRRDTGEPFTFGENDRAVFSIKAGNGQIFMQKECPMENNSFVIVFQNDDTDNLAPGGYTWDVRYVINPYYDTDDPATRKIIDGDQVITPKLPMNMTLLTVVGDI